jgi:hypothetical protein
MSFYHKESFKKRNNSIKASFACFMTLTYYYLARGIA